MLNVFVNIIGVSIVPSSQSWIKPTGLEYPFITKAPARTFSLYMFPSCGSIAVTPVLTGPFPGISFPFPLINVTCPTLTPLTSVILFLFPGLNTPILIPNSWAFMFLVLRII
ncbi:111aa long hypothetical protein [Pyrococcus horikoshii OT3]|uniref:Uncharacterized protein n=1 Tax=Pyrococcus horikoshii (strain ATCC 700860 / DSM 12428 / JCM 9974 / NBRC 100139 / OT-3) TaxID=70601 RepID=O57786_PYRHO|nr:111aa long hypothetical protein [Pyrococcus horikoshii OT3]